MFKGDQLMGGPEVAELHAELTRLTVPARPALARVATRGGHLRRRRLGSAAVGIAVVVGLGVALPVGLSSTPRSHTYRAKGFVLTSNVNGTETITMSPSQTFDATALEQDLASHDIPAQVRTGSFCSSQPTPPGFGQVVSVSPSGPWSVVGNSATEPNLTINPANLPAGTELSFGIFVLPSGGEQVAASLITESAYSCSSAIPPPSSVGFGVTLGPAG